MKHNTLKNIADEAAKFGVTKAVGADRTTKWRVTCDLCGKSDDNGWAPNTPPEVIVKNLRNKRWNLDLKHPPICPSCQETSKMTTKPQLGPDPKIARPIYQLLDDHFNEKTRRYDSNWSDERVATEAKTSPELVTHIRSEAYGELAEDPAVAVVRESIDYLRIEIEDAVAKLRAQAEEAVAKVTTDFNKKLSQLQVQVDKVAAPNRKAAGEEPVPHKIGTDR